MAEQEENRPEKATPHKLQEARKKGQVAKSQDINAAVMLLAFTLFSLATASDLGQTLAERMRYLLSTATSYSLNRQNIIPWATSTLEPVFIAGSPVLLALMLAAIASNVMQTGFIFSTHPITPDFNRMNPAEGFKKFVKPRILFELLKSLVKLGLVGILLYVGFRNMVLLTPSLVLIDPNLVSSTIMRAFAITALILCVVYGVVAVLDLGFARWEFAGRMRMSRRELKDEHKKREGDPEVRSKRRQTQQELRKRSGSLSKVKDADIVLVNPTHLAVALRYRPQTMLAPEIVAMGAGSLAARIRSLATRHSVPVIRRKEVARALFYGSRVGQPVREEFFEPLAPVFRWLMTQPGSKVQL